MTKDTLELAAACLSAVSNRIDEITALAARRGRDAPRTLLQQEAHEIARQIIRNDVTYDATQIPAYLKRFPNLLKVQSGGGDLNGEIEESLHRSYMKLIRPHLDMMLLGQYEEFDLAHITTTLVDVDLSINHGYSPEQDFSRAVTKLKDSPDHEVLADLIVRIHFLNEVLTAQKGTYKGEGLSQVFASFEGSINRLNEIRDYLDLLLEGDGFDNLLTPENALQP